ncbi:hypothetical protein [uncultured Maricaulis sp.]|uniref:hypothetical protein n=1 Tax=uncultured Maricaulis sp. TaxID=174710 RepID=UPI0026037E97|nr:hypothetical protein [uncultured Maricaulis sp.]
MKHGLAILPLIAVAACSGGGNGIDAETRAAYDWAVLEAAPDAAPVYSEVALMGCRMSGGEALCGSCNTTVAAAEYDHVVGAILEEHSLGRVDSQGRIRVSVTSEMDHADFPHNGSRAGIEAAIADAQAWCEAFHPERSEVITDRRETDIATGDDE